MKPSLIPSRPHRVRVLALGIISIPCLAFLMFFPISNKDLSSQLAVHAQDGEEASDTEFQKGLDLLRRQKYEDALKSFKRANDMREKKSAECFYGMAQAYQGLAAYKNVLESCDKVLELAANDQLLQALAYNMKGMALQSQSEGKDQKKLQAAEAAFRQSTSLPGAPPITHYNLGYVLMQQSRDPEGVDALNKYLKLQPEGGNADTARKLIENPRRSREAYAPDFSFTSADGEYIELENLRGKVVVLDFWGTWCPPCVASLPSLRALNKKYAKEPSFVMIAVSSDSEEETWRDFITKEKMVWPQFLDREHKVQRAFNVRAFPTYIVIDHEGIMRYRSSGMSWERAVDLEDAIKRQVKIVAKTAEAR